jgi:hypothetical protein
VLLQDSRVVMASGDAGSRSLSRLGTEGYLAKFRRKAFTIRSYEDISDRSASGAAMRK